MAKRKKNNTLWIVLGLGAAWYLWKQWKKNKQAPGSAANEAVKMVSAQVDKTNFVPDTTTFAELYKKDQENCK